jgi:hypothetical protein
MALAKPQRPPVRAQMVPHHGEDQEGNERMLDQLAERVIAGTPASRSQRTADLVVGANRITTRLGRKATGCTLTPTVPDATFAWAFAADGDQFAIITVVGVDQPACPIEFW